MRPSLALFSLNVNGLQSADKRAGVRHRLSRMKRGGVMCLQETHLASPEQAEECLLSRLDRRGTFPVHLSVNSGPLGRDGRHTRGVATLVVPSPSLQDPSFLGATCGPDGQPDGRAVATRVLWNGDPLVIVNVYAPHLPSARTEWFTGILVPFLHQVSQGTPLLLVGDWNCVLEAQDIVGAGADPAGRRQGSAALRELVAAFDLHDVHRMWAPDLSLATHQTTHRGLITAARLDRVYCPTHLLSSVLEVTLDLGFPSDHRGVSVSFAGPPLTALGKPPWRLALRTFFHPDFRQAVPNLVAEHLTRKPLSPTRTRGQRWDLFLLAVRDASAALARHHAAVESAERRALLALAAQLHRAFLEAPTGANLVAWRRAHRQLCAFETKAALAWEREQQALWQHGGECCTRWFYDTVHRKQTGTAHFFTAVQDHLGSVFALDSQEASLAAGQVFSDFYSSDHPQGLFAEPAVSLDAQNTYLAATTARFSESARDFCEGLPLDPITVDELRAALDACPSWTAPGPDGVPYGFYKAYWDLVGEELTAVLNEAFELRYLPLTMREGTIILIHKDGPRERLGNYRPITLLNCGYKLLAKALALRFAGVLHQVIGPQQTGFVPGRHITDNILEHIAVIEDCESRLAQGEDPATCTAAIAFVDFQKAYDSLSRDWLRRVLHHFGLGPRLCQWIDVLYADSTCRVAYNNWLSPAFPVRSGVRQGCPLSPALFVLAVDPLAAYLSSLQAAGRIVPYVLPGNVPVPVPAQQADDLSLKTADRPSLVVAVEAVDGFQAASGLRQKPEKGHLLEFVPASDPAPGLPPPVPPGETVRHLGIRLGTTYAACQEATYTAVLATVHRNAGRWSHAKLSLLGSAHVGKQVLGNTLGHFAACLAPTATHQRDLDSAISSFVAVGKCAPGGASLGVPRCHLALPASLGGLGAPHVPAILAAHQARIILRILSPGRRSPQVSGRHLLRDAMRLPPGQAPDWMTAATFLLAGSLHHLPASLRHSILALRATRPHLLTTPPRHTVQDWVATCPAQTVTPTLDPTQYPWPRGPYCLHLHSAVQNAPSLAACAAVLTPNTSHVHLVSSTWPLWEASCEAAEWASLLLGATLCHRFIPGQPVLLQTTSATIGRAVAAPVEVRVAPTCLVARAALTSAAHILFQSHQPQPPGPLNAAVPLTAPCLAAQQAQVHAGLDPAAQLSPATLASVGPALGTWHSTSNGGLVAEGPLHSRAWYSADLEGRLTPCSHPPRPCPPLVPAVVLRYQPHARTLTSNLGRDPPLYLLGPSHEVFLDPCRLYVGSIPAITARVCHLTARVVAAEQPPPGRGPAAGIPPRPIQPASWQPTPPEPSRLASMDANVAYRVVHGRPPPPPRPDWNAIDYTDTPAMRPSPPRLHPLVRAAARGADPPPYPTADPLARPQQPPPPWANAWHFARLTSIPKDIRGSYWRILHAILHTSAWHAAYPAAQDPRRHDPFCTVAACARGQLPLTVRHLLWDCPLATACWGYASAFLSAACGTPCTICLAHILPSAPAHLPPPNMPDNARALLRLVVVVMAHHLTSTPRHSLHPAFPRSSLATIVDFQGTLRAAIAADWVRTKLDNILDSGPDIHLTRHIRPWSRAAFDAQWPGEGVWFHLQPAWGWCGDDLVVDLDLDSPVGAGPFTGEA